MKEKIFGPDVDDMEDSKKEKENKTSKSCIFVGAGIILIIGVIIILVFTLKKNEEKPNNKGPIEFNEKALKKYKTPFYYYNTTLLEQTLETCLNITKKNNIKIHFSLKSNFNDKILKILSSHKEIGADCVSGGEVNLALKYFKPESIVFAGIGKTDEEIEEAVDNNIFCLNVESIEELDNLNEICKRKKKRMNFATRINPNVLAHTHEKITTGLNENKFGIFLDKYAENFYNKIRDVYTNKDNQYEYLNFIGLHFHIGSQIIQKKIQFLIFRDFLIHI